MPSTKIPANPVVPLETGLTWSIFRTALDLAMDSIRAHKLRSSLTLLGVIIGVASVVLVGAAIEGMGVYADTTTSQVFGSNSFVIVRVAGGRLSRTERLAKLRRNKRIRPEDLQYLRATTGDVIQYSPYYNRVDDVKRIIGDNASTFEGASILGVSAELANIRDIAIAEGRFFTEQEESNRQFVAVIGQDLKAQLFPNGTSLDQVVMIQGYEFRVIGLQTKLGGADAQTQDNSVYIPSTVFRKLYTTADSMVIFGAPRSESGLSMSDSLDMARSALRSRFRTKPGAEDNFDTITPDSVRAFIDSLLALVAAVVVPITAISLVVGGIVIMNIMLVSVTERTREIGIRKAIGARASDIRMQFLIEAVILAAVGGIAGLVLGAGSARVLGTYLEADLPVTLPYAVLAVVVSSVVGIVSGWYPASRASALDPIAALRAE